MLKLAVINSIKYSFNKKSRVSSRANVDPECAKCRLVAHKELLPELTKGYKEQVHDPQINFVTNQIGLRWQRQAGFRRAQQNPSMLSQTAYLQIFATKTFFFLGLRQFLVVNLTMSRDLHIHRHFFQCSNPISSLCYESRLTENFLKTL